MDRKIFAGDHSKISFFKEFEYIDLFPYCIAIIMLSASLYILNAFITIADNMH